MPGLGEQCVRLDEGRANLHRHLRSGTRAHGLETRPPQLFVATLCDQGFDGTLGARHSLQGRFERAAGSRVTAIVAMQALDSHGALREGDLLGEARLHRLELGHRRGQRLRAFALGTARLGGFRQGFESPTHLRVLLQQRLGAFLRQCPLGKGGLRFLQQLESTPQKPRRLGGEAVRAVVEEGASLVLESPPLAPRGRGAEEAGGCVCLAALAEKPLFVVLVFPFFVGVGRGILLF
mmetsp:Transcript_2331/g.6862  ORF Transcript_2331/g.6862 Transcript_2331/m.6862 type:complete len:236 (+) Transcript_2331:541-1248(+)